MAYDEEFIFAFLARIDWAIVERSSQKFFKSLEEFKSLTIESMYNQLQRQIANYENTQNKSLNFNKNGRLQRKVEYKFQSIVSDISNEFLE